MSIWLVNEYGSDRRSTPKRWFTTKAEAVAYCEAHRPKKWYGDELELVKLKANGKTKVVDYFGFVPVPYTGPLVKARIDVCSGPGVHRVPIECWRPHPDDTPYEHTPFRVTANGYVKREGDEFFTCQCGPWQDIEGSPEKVKELTERYPWAGTSGT